MTEVLTKFEQATHTGLHLEKITGARDDRFRTIRIDQFWRGVVLAPENGDTYILLKVLPHDKAYEWAKTRRASINMATGGIELRDVVAMDSALPQLEKMADKAPQLLFEHISDTDLHRLGVDEQTLAFARTLTEPFQVEAAQGLLPPVQWSVPYGLTLGMSPEQVWAELGAQIIEDVDPEDLDTAVERSADRVVLVDGPAELLAVLASPFELWRIYLHPTQRTVVEASYRGSARVSGGPGTGKTVVAIHRAHRLAKKGQKVLLTTFTSTLAEALESSLRLLAETDSTTNTKEVLGRIRVEHVDRLAHQVFLEEHGRPNLLLAARKQQMWQRIVEELEVDLSPAFLAEEWRHVVLARTVGSASEDLNAKRTGRGPALAPAKKAQVWQAVWQFQQELADQGLWTHETVCEEAARLLKAHPDKPFDHVVVDEAQDPHPGQWRLLRATVAEKPDDMFVVGDTHQRIYGPRITLSEIGVTARANRAVDQAVLALEEAGNSAKALSRSTTRGSGISVATMHHMKGLEFRCLAVVGAGRDQLPAPRSVTPASEDTGANTRDLLRERSLLFVACTRAREQLSVSWHQEPSPFLEKLLPRT